MDAKKVFVLFFGGSYISVSKISIDETAAGNDSCVAPLEVWSRVANHPGRSFSRSLFNFLSAGVELERKQNDLKPGSRKVAIQCNWIIDVKNFSSKSSMRLSLSIAISMLSLSYSSMDPLAYSL